MKYPEMAITMRAKTFAKCSKRWLTPLLDCYQLVIVANTARIPNKFAESHVLDIAFPCWKSRRR